MRRLSASTLIAALVLAAGLASARAAEEPPTAQVTVALPGGGQRTVVLAERAGEEDVRDVRYAVRSTDGTTSELTVAAGFSLASLLDDDELDGLTHVLIPRPDGTQVLVLREQLTGEDGRPPVVWVDEQGVHFLRPSANDDDRNAEDLVTAVDGTLAVRVRRNQPYKVRIDASATRARTGTPIRFTASLVVGEQTEDLTFRWYFGDGTPRVRGARVTHRFRRGDVYPVQVNLWKGAWELEAADVVYVRVSVPEPEPADDEPAGAGGGTGTGGTGGSGTGGTGGSGTGTSTSGGGDVAGGAAGGSPRRSGTPPPTVPAPVARGELVSGTLLASADPTPPTGASGSGGRPRTAPTDEPLHVPIGVWIVAVLTVLVAAGWAIESRHTPPFWQP